MSLLQALTSRMAGTKTYAKAVDFDGTNDYLSRASDFTGNADGKTFTFSAWVWNTSSAQGDFYKSSSRFRIDITNSNLRITGQDSGANPILIYTSANFKSQVEIGTFYHVLMSIDLTNASNRHVYINDVAITGGSFGTYTNANIDFTNTAHGIGENFKGRLAHVFLDYTYRDLSNSTNRRLFITADRKPAQGQAALNPILYLLMDNPTTAHINLGTGGNMTLNGTIARSGRGPNQFNVPYSDLDGAADYLSRTTAPVGIADGKQFTFSCVVNKDGSSSIFFINSSTTVRFYVYASTSIQVFGYNSSGVKILQAEILDSVLPVALGRNYTIAISMDLSDVNKRHIFVNGQTYSTVWTTYTNDSINFNPATPVFRVGANAASTPTDFFNGRLGNVFFDTKYIDLSVPANLAKFVTGTGIDAKPVDLGSNGELPFGTAPLIYLPMYGNNAGKNYGTGGDFTVNSGPFLGARGPNEFWGNKADFNGTTGKLLNGAMSAGADSKTFSGSFYITPDSTGTSLPLFSLHDNPGVKLWLDKSGDFLQFRAKNAAGTTILDVNNTSGNFIAGTAYQVLFCFDLSDAGKRFIYISGVSTTLNAATYTNDAVGFSLVELACIGVDDYTTPSTYFDGRISEFYFTTDYIDFSLEANRLLFRDAFGNPTDLPSLIESGAVPNPAVYMRFDPANQGLNSGTGGNFTKSGTITDGGQL